MPSNRTSNPDPATCYHSDYSLRLSMEACSCMFTFRLPHKYSLGNNSIRFATNGVHVGDPDRQARSHHKTSFLLLHVPQKIWSEGSALATFLFVCLSFSHLSHDMRFPTMWYVRPAMLRPACAYAQSDQSLCYSLKYS